MHGPTFMANPLACAVALASLELLADGRWREQVAGIERAPARAASSPPGSWTRSRDVRVLGAIGVIELDHPVDVGGGHRGGARAGRLAAAVPGADLRDAAVHHRRAGPGPDRRRDARRRARRLTAARAG